MKRGNNEHGATASQGKRERSAPVLSRAGMPPASTIRHPVPNHQTVKRTAPQDRLGALNAKPEHIGGIHKRKRDRIRVGNIG